MRGRSRRNPDLEAYRDWQSDRSDRGALQRYIFSLMRDGLNNMEKVLLINGLLEICDPLRSSFENSLKNNRKTKEISFRDWYDYVERNIFGKNPVEVLSFIEVGVSLGFSYYMIYAYINDITDYFFLDRDIVDSCPDEDGNGTFLNTTALIQYIGDNLTSIDMRHACLIPLIRIGMEGTNRLYFDVGLSALERIGVATYNTIDFLVYSSKLCISWRHRLGCIETLFLLAVSCKKFIDAIVDRVINDSNDSVRVQSILYLNLFIDILEEKNLRDIVFVLENHGSITVRASCAEFLGKHEGSKGFVVRALSNVLESSVDDENSLLYNACRTAIEQITGEAPK